MTLLNYNNSNWSRSFNCNGLNDCSGRTISDNGAYGISLLSKYKFNHSESIDLFHLGIDVTVTLGTLSLFDKKFSKYAIGCSSILALLYFRGRSALNQ